MPSMPTTRSSSLEMMLHLEEVERGHTYTLHTEADHVIADHRPVFQAVRIEVQRVSHDIQASQNWDRTVLLAHGERGSQDNHCEYLNAISILGILSPF